MYVSRIQNDPGHWCRCKATLKQLQNAPPLAHRFGLLRRCAHLALRTPGPAVTRVCCVDNRIWAPTHAFVMPKTTTQHDAIPIHPPSTWHLFGSCHAVFTITGALPGGPQTGRLKHNIAARYLHLGRPIRSHPAQAGHARIARIPLVFVKTLYPNCRMPLPAKHSMNGERRLHRIDNARKRHGAANNAQMKEIISVALGNLAFSNRKVVSRLRLFLFPPQNHAWPTKCLAHPITCLNMERRPEEGPCRLQRSAHIMV